MFCGQDDLAGGDQFGREGDQVSGTQAGIGGNQRGNQSLPLCAILNQDRLEKTT